MACLASRDVLVWECCFQIEPGPRRRVRCRRPLRTRAEARKNIRRDYVRSTDRDARSRTTCILWTGTRPADGAQRLRAHWPDSPPSGRRVGAPWKRPARTLHDTRCNCEPEDHPPDAALRRHRPLQVRHHISRAPAASISASARKSGSASSRASSATCPSGSSTTSATSAGPPSTMARRTATASAC